jgi:hypothetical protein
VRKLISRVSRGESAFSSYETKTKKVYIKTTDISQLFSFPKSYTQIFTHFFSWKILNGKGD